MSYQHLVKIGLFLSIFDAADFTRLTSLTLHRISSSDERIFSSTLIHYPLTTLSISSSLCDKKHKNHREELEQLVLAIVQTKITNLTFHIQRSFVDERRLIQLSALKSLSIYDCTYELFCDILSGLPNLRMFAIEDYFNLIPSQNNSSFSTDNHISFPQLASLLLAVYPGNMNSLKPVFSLVPS